MKQFIESVVDSIVQSGLVEVEVSARHVHLTQEDVELLFGKGAVLHSGDVRRAKRFVHDAFRCVW